MNVHDAVLLFGAFVTILTAWGIAVVTRYRVSEHERLLTDHGKSLTDIKGVLAERGTLVERNEGDHRVFRTEIDALKDWRGRQEDRWTHERPAP